MVKRRKRIMYRDILAYDGLQGTSYVRELEMAVDAIVTFEPAYAVQFWTDVKVYGLDEAKSYLIRFVEKSYNEPDELAQDIAALSSKIEEINDKLNLYRRG